MKNFVAQVGLWLQQNWPWIAGALLPSIATALMRSPSEKISKWGDLLKKILSFVSVLTFKDAPGTLQMPLNFKRLVAKPSGSVTKTVDPKEEITSPSGVHRGPLPKGPAGILVLLLSLTLFAPNCSWWRNLNDEVKDGLVMCAKDAVLTGAKDFVPTIMAILTASPVNWEAQLNALYGIGTDAFACAMEIAAQELRRKSLPEPGEGMTTDPEKLRLRANSANGEKKARLYMQKKNIKVQF